MTVALPGPVAQLDPARTPPATRAQTTRALAAARGDDSEHAARRALDRAESWGARAATLDACLTAGLTARGEEDDRATLCALACAGWRAGATALRDDALARAAEDLDAGGAVAAAALGMEPPALPELLERQRSDRWWFPGRDAASGYVASVGGFAGYGASWVSPADAAVAWGEGGTFAVRADHRWWTVAADAFGTVVRALPADAPGADALTEPARWHAADAREVAAQTVAKGVRLELIREPRSYLLWLRAEPA